jgi:hypothetical protein
MPSITATSPTRTITVPHFLAVREPTFWEGLSEDERRASINPNRFRVFGEKTGWQPAGLVSTTWNIEVYPAIKRIINSPGNYEKIFRRSKIHMSRPCSLYMVGDTAPQYPGEELWRRARPTIVSISAAKHVAESLSNLLESIESLRRLNHGFEFMFIEDKRMKLRTVDLRIPVGVSQNSNLSTPIPERVVVPDPIVPSVSAISSGRFSALSLPSSTHDPSVGSRRLGPQTKLQDPQVSSQPVHSTSLQPVESVCGIPVHFMSEYSDVDGHGAIGGVISINGVGFGLCAAHPFYSDGTAHDDIDSDMASTFYSDIGGNESPTKAFPRSSDAAHRASNDESRVAKLWAKLREGAVISVFQDESSESETSPQNTESIVGHLYGHLEPGRDPMDLEIFAERIFCTEMDWALIKLKQSLTHEHANTFAPVHDHKISFTEISDGPPQGEVFVAYRRKTKYSSWSKSNGVLDGIILPGTHRMIDVWTVETACGESFHY